LLVVGVAVAGLLLIGYCAELGGGLNEPLTIEGVISLGFIGTSVPKLCGCTSKGELLITGAGSMVGFIGAVGEVIGCGGNSTGLGAVSGDTGPTFCGCTSKGELIITGAGSMVGFIGAAGEVIGCGSKTAELYAETGSG